MPVRAQAGAKRTGIQGVQADALKVSVAQAPEKGKANKAIQEVLAKELDLKRAQIELISGETSNQKRFLIRNITADQLRQRINAVIEAM